MAKHANAIPVAHQLWGTYHTKSKAEELDDIGHWHRIQSTNHSVEYGHYGGDDNGYIITDSQNNRQASSCQNRKNVSITSPMSAAKSSNCLVFIWQFLAPCYHMNQC